MRKYSKSASKNVKSAMERRKGPSYRLHTGLNRNKAPAFPHKRWARHRTLSVFRSDYLIREGADGQVQQRPSRATEKSAEA